MLIDSEYPMDENMRGGLTALIIGASDQDAYSICVYMIEMGANINKVSDLGQSALSQAVHGKNMKIAELLIK